MTKTDLRQKPIGWSRLLGAVSGTGSLAYRWSGRTLRTRQQLLLPSLHETDAPAFRRESIS